MVRTCLAGKNIHVLRKGHDNDELYCRLWLQNNLSMVVSCRLCTIYGGQQKVQGWDLFFTLPVTSHCLCCVSVMSWLNSTGLDNLCIFVIRCMLTSDAYVYICVATKHLADQSATYTCSYTSRQCTARFSQCTMITQHQSAECECIICLILLPYCPCALTKSCNALPTGVQFSHLSETAVGLLGIIQKDNTKVCIKQLHTQSRS